ncbi:hypothetical protein FACS189494_09310 [Spirochaetia bacterium]|nr:hypothetical protein FACS189494_09310 [Spirochaetia bacterium]
MNKKTNNKNLDTYPRFTDDGRPILPPIPEPTGYTEDGLPIIPGYEVIRTYGRKDQPGRKYIKHEDGTFVDITNVILSQEELLKLFDEMLIIDETKDIQTELFPQLKLQKNINLKKDFALNLGNVSKIKTKYAHLLETKLISGKTLAQQLDAVENWFNNLHGKDLGLWVKLFGFMSAVKEHKETYTDIADLQEVIGKSGVYLFRIKANKQFYDFFIKQDKTMKRHTTKAKEKLLKWLYDNQNTIDFPVIIDGKLWNIPRKIYSLAENISDKELLFNIDTNILASEFKDFVSIDINEVDTISDAWQEAMNSNADFKKYQLSSFEDLPLKFLLILKQIYNKSTTFKTDNGYVGNVQKLKREHLNERLGNLKDRITIHSTKTKTNAEKTIHLLLLNTVFDIAKNRKWLSSKPNFKDGIYHFNINNGYFDKKNTAKMLAGKT